MLIPEPIDKMGIHALPLAKEVSIKFHPSLSKESGTSQVAKSDPKKQLKSFAFPIDFGKGKRHVFVDFSGGVLIDFHGFQINNLQVLGY